MSLELRLPGDRLDVLEAVVLLGVTQPAETHSEAAETIRRHTDNIVTDHPSTQ